MSDAPPPDNLILTTIQRLLAQAGPRQAEVMRACAVPRWFDLGVLELLRGRAEGNERVLELLRGYSFVRPLGAGRYAYQEDVRAALLEEWRAQRPQELRAMHQRLAQHFTRRAPEAPDGSQATNQALWQREALYHQLMADLPAGIQQLRAMFEQAEASYRLADCEALLQTAREAPVDQAGQLWLGYLRARLDRLGLRLEEAASQLEVVLAAPTLDPLLQALARLALGEVLAETGQWVGATALYRRSLDYFAQAGDGRRAAETMLRLGEAYHGLGDDTGGWYVPAYTRNPFWRALGQCWSWLQALSFSLIVALLRSMAIAIPRARYLGPYQNWPLIWLYRSAQGWYRRALAAFQQLGDQAGVARATQRLAELQRVFGYPAEALAQLDQLAGASPYQQSRIDCGRAAALLDQGQTAAALALLDPALVLFRELGDARGEAIVLALQGHAAAAAGRVAEGLESYRSSLTRFRAIGYTEAREQALSDLRAWRRRLGPGPASQQIGAILAEEPEKRYVARFPSSKIALLQVLSLAALPLALLLSALASATNVLRVVSGSQPLLLETFYSPGRMAWVLLFLLALYILAYTLMALLVIFFVPLNNLEREQPDYVITSVDMIRHYDSSGMLAERMRWDAARRWLRFDQQLWKRPLPLFSGTLLEDAASNVKIPGIISWYTSLQEDIAMRLRAAGNPLESEARGIILLRSKSGALFAAGAVLLLLFIVEQNGWNGGLTALPPPLHALLEQLAFSGALMLIPLAYWAAARPLAWVRVFLPDDRWQYIIGALGLAMLLLYLVSGGSALPVPALNIGLMLWGVYLAAEALGSILLPHTRWARLTLVVAALLSGAALAAPLTAGLYYKSLGKAYFQAGNYAAAERAYGWSIETLPANQRRLAADAWNNRGVALYQQQQFDAAARSYQRAGELLLQEPASAERNQYIAALLFNRSWARRQLGDPNWSQDLQNACGIAVSFCARR